jgi:hypothetical protein
MRSNVNRCTKVTRIAAERSAQKRLDYLMRIGGYEASQLVFVDESSVDRRTTYRGYAWSIRGTQAQRKSFFVRGRRYVPSKFHVYTCSCSSKSFSVLPAISLNDGVLHCEIVEGSFCAATFYHFVEGLLANMQPYPAPNLVIVMDNCRIHKHPRIQALIEAAYVLSVCIRHYLISLRGMRCEFLPPYSPDFNPIELAFSFMKYHLRRNGDYVRMAMTQMGDHEIFTALLKSVYAISPHDVRGWYQYCSYI